MKHALGSLVAILSAVSFAPPASAVGLPDLNAAAGTLEAQVAVHSVFVLPLPAAMLDYTPMERLHLGIGMGFVGTFDGAFLNPFDMGSFARATMRLIDGPLSTRWGASLLQGFDYHFAPGMVGVASLTPVDSTRIKAGPRLEGPWSQLALNAELPIGGPESPLTLRAMWGVVYGTTVLLKPHVPLVWPPAVEEVPTWLLVPNLEVGFRHQDLEVTVGGLSYFGFRRRF